MKARLDRKIYIEISMHVFAWMLILNMHLISFDNTRQITLQEYLKGLMFPATFLCVFYLNYFLIIPRLLFTKRMAAFFVVNVLLYGAAVLFMDNLIMSSRFRMVNTGPGRPAIDDPMPAPPPDEAMSPRARQGPGNPRLRPIGRIPGVLIALTMTTGVAVAIHTTKKWLQSEELRADLEREHLKSELANLKNQLNPHFLFNTLNNIYSLISQNQEKAQESVHQLSKLMRYLLYDSNEKFVPLTKEVDFMHNYIDLMKLRITPNVHVTYDFPKGGSGILIAPLLFISLIENSFKHGISVNNASEIHMEMKATQDELNFLIRNTAFPKKDTDRSGSGIGIENLKKRLSLLYPGRHELKILQNENFYETTLKVKI